MAFYRVIIWSTKTGIPRIGVKYCKKDFEEQAVDFERVQGSQIPHRVVANTSEGYKIMTPTQAKKAGYGYQHF